MKPAGRPTRSNRRGGSLRPMIRLSHGRPLAAVRLALLLVVTLVAAGCARVLETAPAPTPGDFPGIASVLGQRGIRVDAIASGDAGCADAELARTAIRFTLAGADQATPVTARIYIFGTQAAYDRRRQSVDACARAYITDPAELQVIDAAPFVLVGQGPWATNFATTVKRALREAAAQP